MVKFAMFILLALLLLCYEVGNVYCVHENSTDLDALLDFKQSITGDPNGALGSWNTSIHYCRWKHVICTQKRPWRVSGINLTGQSLVGQITSSLASLTFLSVVDLSLNSFSGELPALNGLQQLDTLYLDGNSLEGNIPDSLTNCSKLKNLDLSSNKLSGTIPPNIGSLSNLEILVLKENYLSGIIPKTFTNLTRLSFCNIRSNQIEGSIPNGVWQLSNMAFLQLGNNSLSGEIPRAINMPRLQVLGLELNKFGKALPSNLGNALPSLQQLTLGENTFEGHIPASLGNASGLQVLDLSNNSFTGPVPVSLGNLSNLNELNLDYNNLEAADRQSWKFLDALRNCKSLTLLSLFGNRLQGDIPDSVGSISTTLTYLSFGRNELTGIVPPTIGNLFNLVRLGLEENNLSGSTEAWVGKLKNLQGLYLNSNNFTGPIPSSIASLTRLTLLFLDRNGFEGPMPVSSIKNLAQLTVLDLSYNNFQGDIPPGFGNLKQLIALNLSSNKLTGEIPYDLGQCQNLVDVRMDKNFLTGDIPSSLGDLKSLSLLNLSHNNLSGNIPFTLNNLSVVNKIDLSYNNLQGQIPKNGVLANSTIVSLDGNRGLCGGSSNLHIPSCQTGSHGFGRQYYLVRVLIPIFGFLSLVLLIYLLLLVKKTPGKNKSLNSFGQDFLKVSYNDLAQATRDFSESNLVGRGSYGSVYRGKLKEQKVDVAVKVFNLEMKGAERSFMLECEALRSIQHRNLLPIITACSTVDNNGNVFKALVYEFMPNGNLDTWLHQDGEGKPPNKCLGLTQRISIAVNIADALDYLHHDCGRPTVHCDLKPSNVLLDEDMTAVLGDFGIARFYDDSSSTSACSVSSIGLKGTIGYIAPEYAGGGHASTYGDVYSFGIVLLEMLTGKRPTHPMFKEGLDIVNYVESSFPDQILQVIDPHLIDECKDLSQQRMVPENTVSQCVASISQVALSCTRALPRERMNMKQIATKMHAIKTSCLVWKSKHAS